MFTCFANIIIHKGTKNVAKSMSKIAVGSQKNAGKTWFPELADKRMLIGIQYIMPIICRKEYKSPPVLLYELIQQICYEAVF